MKKKIVVKVGIDLAEETKGFEKQPSLARKLGDHTIYFDSYEQMYSILSAKKLELLEYLAGNEGKTVNEISSESHRKKQAVSRDLHQLENYGLVQMEREGRTAIPRTPFRTIEIPLMNRHAKMNKR